MRALRRVVVAVLVVAGSAPFSGLAPSGVAGATGATWSVTSTPSPNGVDVIVNDVSCSSVNDCMAVGYKNTGVVNEPFSMHWDGSTWTDVVTPSLSQGNSSLRAVSCVSATFCVAVGTFYDLVDQRQTAMPLHWDGTAWNGEPSTQTGAGNNWLTDVSCTGSSDCTAVGYYHDGVRSLTLARRWNGTAWSVVASPNQASPSSNILNSVSCVSATACMAVGTYTTGGSSSSTLALRWDGSSWSSTSATPNGAEAANYLAGVSCLTAVDCVAVGYSTDLGSSSENLATRWNGTSWAMDIMPAVVPGEPNRMYSVSCAGPNFCIAVGRAVTNGNYVGTILEWDGSFWTVPVAALAVSGEDTELLSVWCVATDTCAAVGYTTANQANRFLSLGLWSMPNSPPTPPTPPADPPVVGPSYTG